VNQYVRFLREFMFRPGSVGAVSPSSEGLAKKMVEWIDWPEVHAVAEYGPGTGVFTEHILQQMRPGTRLVAVEINPTFAATVRGRFPDVAVHEDSVGNIREICRKEQIEQLDAVICGLPWAAFSRKDQLDYLDALTGMLRPGGQFVTFAYLQGLLLPAGQRFKALLRQYFSDVTRSGIAWRNVPPAFVYRCRRAPPSPDADGACG
jgi:phosphatidylethanolamine/phosphatidyl-N-methylethanolamine N-methyltransferase